MIRLEKIKKILCNVDEKRFQPTLSDDSKLYILNSLDEYQDEILNQCDELGVRYCMSREPVFGDADPNTLMQPLVGFANYQYWFEIIE